MELLNTITTIVTVVIIVGVVIHRYITANPIKPGKAFSSGIEQERVTASIWDRIQIKNGKKRALKCIKQYVKQKEERHISVNEAKELSEKFIKDIITMVNARFPDNGFYDTEREVVLTSSSSNRKNAIKDYNGLAWTCGVTEISYAYFEAWMDKNTGNSNFVEKLIANVLFHEAGHHTFRLFTGLHITRRNKIMYYSYIDECFADLYCFKTMGMGREEASKFMENKYKNVMKTKNNYKYSHSHPSNTYRIENLARGIFAEESLKDIAYYINAIKGREIISTETVKEVVNEIISFHKSHPYLGAWFTLSDTKCDKE